jgi:hypothetical protein
MSSDKISGSVGRKCDIKMGFDVRKEYFLSNTYVKTK